MLRGIGNFSEKDVRNFQCRKKYRRPLLSCNHWRPWRMRSFGPQSYLQTTPITQLEIASSQAIQVRMSAASPGKANMRIRRQHHTHLAWPSQEYKSSLRRNLPAGTLTLSIHPGVSRERSPQNTHYSGPRVQDPRRRRRHGMGYSGKVVDIWPMLPQAGM